MSVNWTFIEKIEDYSFWKYEDEKGATIYNCTKDSTPPKNEAGYYSYGYLLKVKGLLPGDTVTSILKSIL
jgi:hypothetical protein